MKSVEKKWITSQKALAEVIGVHHVTICRAKTHKLLCSPEIYERLQKTTGIEMKYWASGNRRALANKLRSFFRDQIRKQKLTGGQG